MTKHGIVSLLASSWLIGAGMGTARGAGEIKIVADSIGGVVTSAKGAEAGVWVIAETNDFPTRLIKIVVTDDQGRYLLPQMPKANYKVWVRGYGLVDSQPVTVTPGKRVNLKAVIAPDGRAAAQYYPAEYWMALAKVPPGKLSVDEVAMRLKGCAVCHQLGAKATREIPPVTMALGPFKSSLEAWDRRTKAGQLGAGMSAAFLSLGDQRRVLSDWTDRVAAGEFPKEAPPRPQGIERNIVATEWDWGAPDTYSHDAIATDTRTGTTNPYGKVYGPTQYQDQLLWVDPVKNESGEIKIPSQAAPIGAETKDGSMFTTSPYWGDQKMWMATSSPRSTAMDQKGRVWYAVRSHDPKMADFCKTGSTNKFAQYFPIDTPQTNFGLPTRQAGVYDPETQKFEVVETCTTTDHNQFAENDVVPGNTIFFGQTGAVAWVNTDVWDKTHDPQAAMGWVPFVINTKGDGKITKPWTEPNEPVDPQKDHRISAGCYSVSVSPTDGSVWCSGIGNTRKLVRVALGSNPPETAISEVYEPPEKDADGLPFAQAGGVDVDSEGVVWQNWRGTDQVTAFDRRKCKILNGPTATGMHCPEGWTVYRHQGPHIEGTKLNANYLYLNEVDRLNASGLGKDAVLEQPNNSDAVLVLMPKTREWVTLRVPYPQGQLWRAISWRIDDPNAGWKGRGLWTSDGFVAPWHLEGGKGEKPKVVHIQVRPNPLAN